MTSRAAEPLGGVDLAAHLSELWSELAGRPARDDDAWFDTGGTIMRGYRLFERLSELTGTELWISALFRYPTLAGLRHYLVTERHGSTVTRRYADLPGPGAQVIYVPGAFGEDYHARGALANLRRPVRWLRAEGLDHRPPLYTLEAMVEDYCPLVGSPSGRPLVLAGYSMGGCVAWLMAEQLAKRGHEVAAVLLFDTYPPGFGVPPGPLDPDSVYTTELLNTIRNISRRPEMRGIPAPPVQGRRRDELDLGRIERYFAQAAVLPPGLSFAPFDRRLALYGVSVCASQTFTPPSWPGAVIHLTSGDVPGSVGFGPYARRMPLGAHHMSFFFQPELPVIIDDLLDEIGV